jgi:Ca-activated chloride channel family protein
MNFLHPYFFWLLLLVPLLILNYYFRNNKKYASISFNISDNVKLGWKSYALYILFFLRLSVVILIIIALARPQSTDVSTDILEKNGIDIMLCLDVSTSMLAEDFKPNRIEAAKELAIDFIQRRNNDRIGLVIYSAESFTHCPLTTDHDILINIMNDVKTGLLEDGTAIGLGLANCVNRLKDSKADSKVIILITDGENNSGFIDPVTAADIARQKNIKTYTIGVGSYGDAPYPTTDIFGRATYVNVPANIDEDMLRLVADTTGGTYFRANKKSELARIYNEIELLEKTKIEEIKYYNVTENYLIFSLFAFFIFILELLLDYTLFKKIN